jgi:hypothetical protein
LSRFDDIPVPVLLVVLVVFERGDSLGQKPRGAFLGDGRNYCGERYRQKPEPGRNHWYLQPTTPVDAQASIFIDCGNLK